MDFLVLSRKCNAYASRYLLQPLFLDRLPSQYLLMIYTAYFLRRKYGCELIESRVLKIIIKNNKIIKKLNMNIFIILHTADIHLVIQTAYQVNTNKL